MLTLKIMAAILAILLGIPNQIIDYKHRKQKRYEPGNAWGYYARLSRDGSWEGKFMIWSSYLAIGFIIVTLGYTFYVLSR